MRIRSRLIKNEYPGQFWLMFAGMFISTIGASMIWPFLMIYVSEKIDQPLTVAASLMTINAIAGIISSFIAGPIVDRLGRKWVMVVSLFLDGLAYLLLSQASSLLAFAVLMGLRGAVNPLYRVGADAMMADLIPAEKRIDAYSLLRLSNNLGISVGPAIGGFIATASYSVAFYCAAIGLVGYSLMLLFRARETLPVEFNPGEQRTFEPLGGYTRILKDRQFLSFTLNFTLTQICAAMIWILLSVYTKTNYGIPESQYSFIPVTNALMVVLLQVPITMLSKQYKPLPVMAVGSLLYTIAVTSIGFGTGFWGFWVSMVIMTFGELILVPTSSTFAANLAPADMRGRYMSIYGLSWSAAAGIGPVYGGLLNDNLGPQTTWFGGGIVGLFSTLLFVVFAIRRAAQNKAAAAAAPAEQ